MSYSEKYDYVNVAVKAGFKPRPYPILAPSGENVLLWEGVSPGDLMDQEYRQAVEFMNKKEQV